MVEPRTSVLLVDDRSENLLALEAILEPLDLETVRAESGEEALRRLLERDFAVILLDVQMPGIDGFETAAIIKQRERTRHVPIIFLTAISKEARHVARGYEAGAVDYLFKPFDPEVLRSKVAAFTTLHEQRRAVELGERRLREAERERQRRELDDLRRFGEERYRNLADAVPALVFTTRSDGSISYTNERWNTYFGDGGVEALRGRELTSTRFVHRHDLDELAERWRTAVDRPERLGPGGLEAVCRLRRRDGVYRWHMVRMVPFGASRYGTVDEWIGTAADADEAHRRETAQRVLAEAGSTLGRSIRWDLALAELVQSVVPALADGCAIDVLDDAGDLRRHAEARTADMAPDGATRVGRMLATDVARTGFSCAVAAAAMPATSGASLFDEDGRELRSDRPAHTIIAPLVTRGEVLGTLTLAMGDPGRVFESPERTLAWELALRVANAIDLARLYGRAEERAQAAEVLNAVGDGVFLVDSDGIVRLWNRAAASITGVASDAVLGRAADEVVPGWHDLRDRVPVHNGPEAQGQAGHTVPVESDGRDLWLSVIGVGFDRGTVYAFRDLTEERAVERMKSDFVATVSHELRTPLAAIYGAAATMGRTDIEVSDATEAQLLGIISDQSQRLADIINDVLFASRIDSGTSYAAEATVRVEGLTREVIEAANVRAPEAHEVLWQVDDAVPAITVDPGHLKQVLANLVDNAIKYSPDGGTVSLQVGVDGGRVRFAVSDEGLGIPAAERSRVFEKFYRVDANMSRGIGGTGLGLYICRELVRQMHGSIWFRSTHGQGTTFYVELPPASGGGDGARPEPSETAAAPS